jgi:hypothetical protein
MFAQAVPTASVIGTGTTASGAGPSGIIPFNRGLNASLGTSSQHDSSNGWSSILTPGAAYRFTRAVSINASIPIYASINVETNIGTKTKPVYVSTTKHGVAGDASFAAVLETHPQPFDYTATFAIGLPSGNTAYGLGAGHASYNFNNHFEKSLGIFSPNIEVGIANSSRLIATRVPATIYFAGRGRKKTTTTASSTPAEDNGFDASLDVPLSGHVTFSGFYNRSIRSTTMSPASPSPSCSRPRPEKRHHKINKRGSQLESVTELGLG